MRIPKKIYIVAYDIRSNKIRTRVAKLLTEAGLMRVNKSVYEGHIPQHLNSKIFRTIHRWLSKHDTIVIYPVNTYILRKKITLRGIKKRRRKRMDRSLSEKSKIRIFPANREASKEYSNIDHFRILQCSLLLFVLQYFTRFKYNCVHTEYSNIHFFEQHEKNIRISILTVSFLFSMPSPYLLRFFRDFSQFFSWNIRRFGYTSLNEYAAMAYAHTHWISVLQTLQPRWFKGS